MRFMITVLFGLILASKAVAGATLSLEEAERLFLENNLDIKTKKVNVQKADAEITKAKTLPNPALKYYLESLRNSENEKEETFAVSQSVDLSGRRAKKINAALENKEAGIFFLNQEIAGLLSQMKQTYYRVLFFKAKEKALTDMAGMFSAVVEKTGARVKAGDASHSDFLKLSAEKGKLIREIETLRTHLKIEKRKLGLLLDNPESDSEISDEFTYYPVSFQIQELHELRLKNRPDLQGMSLIVSASQNLLSAAKREAVPLVDLEAGYKKRTGGFEGFVFGITVPLPFFDRNQAGIAKALAEQEQARLSFENLKKTSLTEIHLHFEQLTSLERRFKDLSQQLDAARELTKIAAMAYEEGETGLLEWLEAVRTEKDFVMEYNNAVFEHWSSLFELEKATGKRLIKNGGAK